jgi:hypothetical protein|tara:strand:+ start:6453 stop:6722 length:270 start_codon:yes stop_codon:yes gene_type:complete
MTDNIRTEVLRTAIELINGDREKDYGTPEENFTVIAEMWSSYLGLYVKASDVCNMMVLLKIARLRNGQHMDSSVDTAGYAALSAEMDDA